MNTQQHLEEIVHRSKELTKRLEQQLANDNPLHTTVETFIREISQMSPSCNLDLLVYHLIHEKNDPLSNEQLIQLVQTLRSLGLEELIG